MIYRHSIYWTLAFIIYSIVLLEIFEYLLEKKVELIDYDELECGKMFENDKLSLDKGSLYTFNDTIILEKIRKSNNKCVELQRIFNFYQKPQSKEEEEYPLAYGMLIHDGFVQISLLLSAIYQPQNLFCLAIDANSEPEFIEFIDILSTCYPNIHYFITEKIRWCGYEILTSVLKCVDFLANSKHDWKYYQYLSGVDAPLKSNLEMVRIFKQLNGSFNAEIGQFEWYRLNGKRPWKSPLPMYKTSLSATFSRESANFIVQNEKVKEQVNFLRGTECADESLWATIAGNPNRLAMPGGFNARQYLLDSFYRKMSHNSSIVPPYHTYNVTNYYISRYQQYVNRPPAKCQGYYYRFSCVFGVYDLPNLVKRHELVAHKLYFSYQPAAFLCLIANTRRKYKTDSHREFTAVEYRNLPNSPFVIS